MAIYLYRFLPGDRPELLSGLEAWTDEDREVGEEHRTHLVAAAEAGIVLLAGRSQDWEGPAIVVFEAESDEAAEAFMESDPFVSTGLFEASLHPFGIAAGRLV